MPFSLFLDEILNGTTKHLIQIDDNKPGINNHAPEIAASLSRLYIRLQELGIGEEAVAEEVEDLCRTLSL